jgi:hypothetical protein
LKRRERFDLEQVHAGTSTWKADAALKAAVLAAGGPNTVAGRAVAEGKAVTVTGNMTAGLGSAGNKLLGIVETYHSDDVMTVQDKGYASFTGVSGSLPTAASMSVMVVNGAGAVQASTGAAGNSFAVGVGDAATGPVMVFIG